MDPIRPQRDQMTLETPTRVTVPLIRQQVLERGFACLFVQPAFPKGWAADLRAFMDATLLLTPEEEFFSPGERLSQHSPDFFDWYRSIAIGYAQSAFATALTLPPLFHEPSLSLHRLPNRFHLNIPVKEPGLAGILFLNTNEHSCLTLRTSERFLTGDEPIRADISAQEGLFVLFSWARTSYCLCNVQESHPLYFASVHYRWPSLIEGNIEEDLSRQ